MNKKGQMDIIAWIVVVVALLFLAPIMLKIVNTSLDSFSTALNTTSPEAADNVTHIHTSFVSFWDWWAWKMAWKLHTQTRCKTDIPAFDTVDSSPQAVTGFCNFSIRELENLAKRFVGRRFDLNSNIT